MFSYNELQPNSDLLLLNITLACFLHMLTVLGEVYDEMQMLEMQARGRGGAEALRQVRPEVAYTL